MKVLRDILLDKEASIKRLEKEIEAIRTVLSILEQESKRAADESQDASGQVMWELGMDVAEVMAKASASPDVLPPVAAPFTATAAAAVTAATGTILKPVSKSWP